MATTNGKKYNSFMYDNPVLYKVRFENGYCEYIKARSSLEAITLVKNGIPGILMIFAVGLWQWSTRKGKFKHA